MDKAKKAFLLVGTILFFVGIFLRICLLGSWITDISGDEQNVVYSIQMLLHNGALYASPALPPFPITQYCPLYYVLCGLAARILGVDPSAGIHQIYVIGRTLDLVCNLLSALLVYKIAKRIFRLSEIHARLLFFMSFTFSFAANFAVRPDSLADLMAIGSIYYFLLYQQSLKTRLDWIRLLFPAILFSGLSLFSKQSGIQLIIIFLGFSFLIKDWKSFGGIVVLGALVYGSFLGITLHYYPFFLQNVIGGISNGISLRFFLLLIIGNKLFILSVLPFIVLSAWVIWKRNRFFKGNLAERFLSIALAGTLLFATVTALKMGSTIQYYVLFMGLSFLFAFEELYSEKAEEQSTSNLIPYKLRKYFYWLCLLLMFMYIAYDLKQVYTDNFRQDLIVQRVYASQVVDFMQRELANDPGAYVLAHMSAEWPVPAVQGINNALFKNCLFPQLDIMENSSKPLKIVDYDYFEQLLQSGKVHYIIEFIPGMTYVVSKNFAAIKRSHYRLLKEMNGYYIYQFAQ
jgi:hypothetical protein